MERITEKALCMSISFRSWGVYRKAGVTPDAETQADKRFLNTTKRLANAPEYVAIQALDNQINKMLRRRCVPLPLQRSVWLVPIESLPTVEADLEALVNARRNLVEELVAAMPRIKDEARAALADLYVEGEYPSDEELRRMYSVRTAYVSLDVPGALGQLDKALFENEKRKAETRWAEAAEEIQAAMREAFAELVEKMAERLTPSEDGKRKIFRDSLVGNLTDFLDTFKSRNLTNDAELDALVEKARSLVAGVDPGEIRKSDTVRSRVLGAVREITAQAESLVCDRPGRRFSFDEE